jgi:predicted heme/steroid binding protein/uncharacterized membrane protein
MKEIDPEDLPKYNGKDGNPVYIVYKDRVIDVSASRLWKTGRHMNRHQSGQDLTVDIQAAPHGLEVLDRYPQVGVLKKEEIPGRVIPGALAALLKRFPMLRRHPHPMTIHFPIAFMMTAPLFTLFYLLTGISAFETTGLHCLGAGLFFIPIGIGTGFYTWWLNYEARPLRPVKIKKRAAFILLLVAAITMAWRILEPSVATASGIAGTLYLILLFSLIPLVTIIGWFGAQMTFPVERE